MESDPFPEYLFKVLVLGDPSTGKTSFIKRYVHQSFATAYRESRGVDIASKMLLYDDRALVRLQFWDIAGDDRFGLNSWTRLYNESPAGAFLAFDVTRRDTFQSMINWKLDLDTIVPGTPCILLANKSDLAETGETNEQILEDFARQNGFVCHLYTSARYNSNIVGAVKLMIEEIMRRRTMPDILKSIPRELL